MQNKVRNSNMELLRIFSMIIIVLSHYVYHGGLLEQEFSTNQIFAQLLKMGGKLGVTCFVFISAYYLIEAEFKSKNIFKLIFQISFYAVILIIIKLVMTGSISGTESVESIFAPIYNVYWFPTAYIGMYLVFPLINIIINKYNQACLKLVLLLTVPFSIIHFLFIGSDFLYSNLTWFLYLYLWGGVFRKCDMQKVEKKSTVIAILCACLIWVSSIGMTLIGLKTANNTILSHAGYCADITSPLVIACAIGVFFTFKKLDIGCNRIINSIAKLTFPVYLLHDNPYFRQVFWKDIVRVEKFYDANFLILLLHMATVVVGLFVAASIVEWCRIRMEKLLFTSNYLNRVIDKIDKVYL